MVRSTNNSNQTWRFTPLIYCLVLVAAAGLMIATLVSAFGTKTGVGIPLTGLLIRFSVTIPELVVWVIALACAIRFKHYAMTIKQSRDGASLDYVANGLLWLVAYVIAVCLGGAIVEAGHNSSYWKVAVAIGNYLPLVVALASSLYLYLGSRRLAELVDGQKRDRLRELYYIVPFLLFVVLFAMNFYMNAVDLTSEYGLPRFVASLPVLMTTYVTPYVLMWLLGMLACLNLAWYSYHAPGSLYKRLFRNLYQGILVVLISIFLAQVLTITPVSLASINIGLIAIYAVLALAIAGFALVYRGTQKLERLETVI